MVIERERQGGMKTDGKRGKRRRVGRDKEKEDGGEAVLGGGSYRTVHSLGRGQRKKEKKKKNDVNTKALF